MSERPAFAILGRGRWAGRMWPILAAENRSVVTVAGTRQVSDEGSDDYRSRLGKELRASHAQIAWLCVPPGPHVPIMIEAALDAAMHVVVEKPWYGPRDATRSLSNRARSLGRIVAVHFEYCVLSEVERWRNQFHPGEALEFGGRFFLGRADHTGMPALDNLGSHLLAIRAHAVPRSTLKELRCGYVQPEERAVWLEKSGALLAYLDLLQTKEPIIQRFIARLEASLETHDFPFDLEFAQRVADDVSAVR